MSQSLRSYKEILRRPHPTIAERIPPALLSGAVGAGVGLGLVIVCYLLYLAAMAWRGEPLKVHVLALATHVLIWPVVFAFLFFIRKFLAQSRRLLDASFYWFAAFVTSIGFIMLVWFMGSLIVESWNWYGVMSGRVREENDAIQAQLDRLNKSVSEAEKSGLAEMEQEMKQESDPEKRKEIEKFFKEEIIPSKLKDINANLDKDRQIYQSLLRPEPTPGAMFWNFFTAGPSDEKTPQDAGIMPALIGSVLIGLITITVAVPLGVGAAIYLEEYRAKGWLNKIIQVNITNLAAVPSVFYGILGAYVLVELLFKNLQGEMWTPSLLTFVIGQSNAEAFMHAVFGEKIAARNLLGGGMSLALLTLPVVIVASQEAIRAVPQSLRHAALALGATKWQSIWHHVIPQARSGILTGVILSLSRAIGEAAPLVMFGALTLVTYNPKLLTPFTVMPMQIFNWSDRSIEAWKYNAALASLILMGTLLLLNGMAIWMRQRARRALKAT